MINKFVLEEEKTKKLKTQNALNTSEECISGDGANIWFYASVNEKSVLKLSQELHRANDLILYNKIRFPGSGSHISLHINSWGGFLCDGMAALDCIRSIETPVWTYIDGLAASAATLFSVAGDHRIIGKYSSMLIHQLSSFVWGPYDEIKDEVENLDYYMKTIKNIYLAYTEMNEKDLDDILKRDIWFDAEKCKSLGLVDEII